MTRAEQADEVVEALAAVFRIVNTDNFGSDYPNESFTDDEPEDESSAEERANELQAEHGGDLASRYFKVVKLPYTLEPGFEP